MLSINYILYLSTKIPLLSSKYLRNVENVSVMTAKIQTYIDISDSYLRIYFVYIF